MTTFSANLFETGASRLALLFRGGWFFLCLMKTIEERFWSHVCKRGSDDCWEWSGTRCVRGGYGHFWIEHRKPVYSHRYAWIFAVGPIPDGKWVLHHCDNPPCCNPKHLFIGDAKANHQDMDAKGRRVVARGVDSGRAVLNDDLVKSIRIDHSKNNLGYRKLAVKYGISRSNAQAIVKRVIWKHVD